TAALLADALGAGGRDVELLRRAAPLHDVGKIGIPDGILHKPARLDAEELERMRRHTVIGAKIVLGGTSPLMRVAEEVAISHHERWDGGGYPRRAAGEDIPLVGRIVAVADVFDALTHRRPYKPAWPVDEAVAEIVRQGGTQFDPRVVAAFEALARRDAALLLPEPAPILDDSALEPAADPEQAEPADHEEPAEQAEQAEHPGHAQRVVLARAAMLVA
ncbi:MAG TPA: HD domain-containing phosphohydrolase, partial [Chloroflexota bacterium]|nr:HD domain-containing phosphohydrolase [Chloroflexota bacterium]